MATDEHYTDVSVTLKGQTVKVQVSKELMDHYTSTDPDAKLLAQNLIIQAAMEKTALIPEEPDSNELPDIPPSNTASVVTMVSSASSTGTSTSSGTGWPEKAEKCLLDFFGELDKAPVKNKWLKVSEKMKDIGYNYTSEQCRLKIKALKERHQRISKKRGKSGEGGVEDVLEDKMSETFSTPDCKPVYISESGKDNADANTSGDEKLPGPSHQSAKRVKKCEKKPNVIDILEKAEEDTEKRHREKMEIMKGFLDILGKMVNKE